MKKVIYILFILFLGVSFQSCEKEIESGGTAVEQMAGDWWVRYDHDSYGEDPFGAGFTQLITFNTASNSETEFWLSDEGHFWDYKVKIPVATSSMTFGGDQPVANESYEVDVKIMNGKIIKNAVTLPSGHVTDSIYFEVWFGDLEDATGIANDKLLVGGYRRTGFPVDDH